MILELSIRNYAIIEDLTLEFGPGLNVLSGETGAGKSIVVGAIGLLLGARASSDHIRTGEEEAAIEARVDLSRSEDLRQRLREADLDAGGEIVLRRVVTRQGKNRVYVNGRMVQLGLLREIGEELINVYGQHEHLKLRHPERHTEILDEFGGLTALRDEVEQAHRKAATLRSELDRINRAERDRAQREDFLRFQIAEIGGARLEPGEEEVLRTRRSAILNAKHMLELIAEADDGLYSAEGSVHEVLARLGDRAREAAAVEPGFSRVAELLSQAGTLAEEAAAEVRDLEERFQFEPGDLEAAEDRLAAINGLKRKYGSDIPAVLDYLEKAKKELDEITGRAKTREDLCSELASHEQVLSQKAALLTGKREKAARALGATVEKELAFLDMARTRFEVRLVPRTRSEDAEGDAGAPEGQRIGPRGAEEAEFLVSPNPGEEPRALLRVASGGELSRIMLALKRVVSTADFIPSLIFDEVDAGIGGRVAEVVGEKLRHLAMTTRCSA